MDAAKITETIMAAYKIVKNSGIQEEHLQVEAFKYALAGGAPHTQSKDIKEPSEAHASVGTAGLATMPQALGISADIVELFFSVADGELVLNLPTKALPSSSSAAMRDIAVLLAVGRKYAGLGTGTSFDLIRTACDDNGKLDKKNFAAAMNQLKPRLVTTGKGPAKDLVPKKPADDLARELLVKYNAAVG